MHEEIKDNDGRFIMLNTTIMGIKITIANIYGPNKDDPDFFMMIHQKIEELSTADHKVVAGDFNCILDNNLDKFGGREHHAHKKSQLFIKTWMEECDMVDFWRLTHPELRRYTYHQIHPIKVFTRLDFFLVSAGFCGLIDKADIKPGFKTDHSAVSLNLTLLNCRRGPGFWKFNSSLLSDIEYVNMVKQVIRETVETNGEANHQLLWDTLKDQIRGATIKYSSRKKRMKDSRLKQLQQDLEILTARRDFNPLEVNLSDQIVNVENEIQDIIEEKTKGARIRCKVRWHEHGEKSSKYFLNLEKRQYQNKVISKLKNKKDEIITSPEEILKEERDFYMNLYSSQMDDINANSEQTDFFVDGNPKLSSEQSNEMEGQITEAELLNALKSCSNGKSPGSDGYSVEFYKFFWSDIKDYLLNSINMSYRSGRMSITQRLGLITLLPKKGKNNLYLKNWRPITLLNQDYKLAAKVIATRIKTHLSDIIHRDQTGFIKGRYIGENIIRMLDMLDFTDMENIPAILLLVDFEKAFDSIEWSFIIKAMKYFNFGDSICSWIECLYKDTTSCIINNGWTTEQFHPSRGVRQGCPLSPYLFIIAAEVLSISIRNNPKIIGVDDQKICQYADDTTLFLRFNKESIDTTLRMFDDFQKISGLKVNLDKTEIFPIGSIKNSIVPMYVHKNIKWSQAGVTALGIFITHDTDTLIKQNFEPILTKIQNIIHIWKMRDLTLFGKVTVIKAFLQSQLVYQLSVLPSPDNKFMKRIEKLLFNFLWSNKPDKIKRSTMYCSKDDGGINMPSIECQDKSLKVAWIQRIFQSRDENWCKTMFRHLPPGDLMIFKANLHPCDIVPNTLAPKSNFWKSVLHSWSEIHYKEVNSRDDILDQMLWYNSHLKIQGKVFFYRQWYSKNINHIRDLYNDDFSLLSHNQFCEKYRINVPFLQYYSVISSIPRAWKVTLRQRLRVVGNVAVNKALSIQALLKTDKPSKLAYNKFIACKISVPVQLCHKWKTELGDDDIDYSMISNCFEKIYACTIDTKTRAFQYRLLHRILGVNYKLAKWGIKPDGLCDLCKTHEETYIHLFYECDAVKTFWSQVQIYTNELINIDIPLDAHDILLGCQHQTPRVLDLLIILGKMHIYSCKFSNKIPNINCYKKRVENVKNLEKYVATKNNTMHKFNDKWLT